jgi:monoamine oxidase
MKIVVIGAGASGIMVANILSKKGFGVTILEAEDRIGGRIHTLTPPGFLNTIEAGAEFIHGNLPLTLKLLNKAKLKTVNASMNMHRARNGKITHGFGMSTAWQHFYDALENLKEDTTVEEFLNQNFPGTKYKLLREEVHQMAQGLNLAEPAEVSLLSLKTEWLSEEMQYRPVTGYLPLLEFLYNEAARKDCQVELNQIVKAVEWQPGKVLVATSHNSYEADAVIITTSLGCLQKGKIRFIPEIPQISNYFNDIGFGHVIKLALEFNHPSWENKIPDLGFLFAEQGLTFWTQLEQRVPVIIGWIGNDYTAIYDKLSDEQIIEKCLDVLGKAFVDLRQHFRNGAVFRYTENSLGCGGYSWPKPESKKAVRKINKGIENTIWFAGEAFDPKFETATVEAALESGKYVAGKVIKLRK